MRRFIDAMQRYSFNSAKPKVLRKKNDGTVHIHIDGIIVEKRFSVTKLKKIVLLFVGMEIM